MRNKNNLYLNQHQYMIYMLEYNQLDQFAMRCPSFTILNRCWIKGYSEIHSSQYYKLIIYNMKIYIILLKQYHGQ
ncbi:unnamed protein product [Paramecium pentaurelia]|uniref:Uncharacterized protein n=1 Tax=Paramecium pentaurelia TaxID=43138 RepID=A0A8S1VLE0_9CILI|nr:unnamed protein product [Paramecium pentaurelia]